MTIMSDKFENIACCKALYTDLIDGIVIYDEIYNRFRYPNHRIFAYCPHCGTKLTDYSEEYFDALEECLQKDFSDISESEIPEEFKTDEWWKKRGITGIGNYWKMYDPVKMNNYD